VEAVRWPDERLRGDAERGVEEGLASVQLRRNITSGLAAQVGVVPGVVTELDLTRVDKGPQVVAMLRPGLAQMPAAPGRVTPLRQLSLPIVGVQSAWL